MKDVFIDITDGANLGDWERMRAYRDAARLEALGAANSILERHDSVAIRKILGDILSAMGDEGSLVEARRHYDRALEYATDYSAGQHNLQTHAFLGNLFFDFGHYDEACRHLDMASSMGHANNALNEKVHELRKKAGSKLLETGAAPKPGLSKDTELLDETLGELTKEALADLTVPDMFFAESIENPPGYYAPTADITAEEVATLFATPVKDNDTESLNYIAKKEKQAARKKLGYAAGIVAGVALAFGTFGIYRSSVKPETPKKPQLVEPYVAPAPPITEEKKKFEYHNVEDGQSLWKIAGIHLKDASPEKIARKVKEIKDANGLKGRDPIIHKGDRLVIPLERKMYSITKGDTLSGISYRVLGAASQWPEIYNANKSVIGSNPHLIRPGTMLTIPPGKENRVSDKGLVANPCNTSVNFDMEFGRGDNFDLEFGVEPGPETAYDSAVAQSVLDSYLDGAGAGRVAKTHGLGKGNIYRMLADAKASGRLNANRWDRKLAEATGDYRRVMEMAYSGLSAKKAAESIRQATGFSISESTIYRMRRTRM